jgi:hypothetical protein
MRAFHTFSIKLKSNIEIYFAKINCSKLLTLTVFLERKDFYLRQIMLLLQTLYSYENYFNDILFINTILRF